MDPSSRSTAAATAVVVGLVALAIAVLVAVGSGGGGSRVPDEAASSPTSAPSVPAVPSVTESTAVPSTTLPSDPPTPTRTPSPGDTSAPGEVCVPQVTEKTLRVMTFNIKSARVTGSVDLGKVGDQIAAYQPDIVLMQEVDRGRAWSNRMDMSALLGTRLQMQFVFGGNDVRSPTNMLGNAILSRYPILRSNNVSLPARPGKHRRGLLASLIDVGGIRLEVYSTHLEHTSGADRERQIGAIADLLGPRPAPRLLGGDFNSSPFTATMEKARTIARDTWLQIGDGRGLTAPSGRPRVRIDYLMYESGQQVEITPLQMAVLPTTASDHRAVMATYRLRRDEGQVCIPAFGDG